uniref:Uncharacterized protein n=1 Tax=viral metagenome TaxID=1070528 RepID=A0A6C0C855_9ZZZZ
MFDRYIGVKYESVAVKIIAIIDEATDMATKDTYSICK